MYSFYSDMNCTLTAFPTLSVMHNNGTESLEELLITVVYMARSPTMNVMLYGRMLISVIGLIMGFSLPMFRRKFVAHGSLLMLLLQHCAWNLMLSFISLIDALITAYTFASWRQPEDLIAFNDGYTCFHRKIWHIYAVYGSMTSMFAITIERTFASKCYKNYERSSKRLGYVLSIGQFVLASLFTLGAALTYDFTQTRAHCFVVTRGGEMYHRPLAATSFVLEMMCLIIFCCLLKINQRRLSSNYFGGLSVKYQITENVRALKLLVPVVISHITLTVLVAVSFSVYAVLTMAPHTRAIAEESLGFLHLHAVIVPVFMFVRHRRKWKQVAKTCRINRLHGTALMNEHDKAIMKNW
ncbi:hypothetical protein PRIPAC_85969 [Pristionchus pacificus]|uniref:G protein-coupled receptor n=1 Tax=Pristionchus pacificus TaxID=54126 RepID=A0A2A6BTF6_PRIPA|nr:hypothetical protein PRIPAC_85969 [Pristionchus pacificus]|eukprot:PDM69093.1 G protein-coupled receptor [Pristionchus pacificus]